MTWFHCWFSTDSTSGAPNPQAVWGAGQSMQAQINLCKQQISGHLPVCTSLSLVQAEVRMCVPADHSCKGCTRTAHFLCSPVPLFPPPPRLPSHKGCGLLVYLSETSYEMCKQWSCGDCGMLQWLHVWKCFQHKSLRGHQTGQLLSEDCLYSSSLNK